MDLCVNLTTTTTTGGILNGYMTSVVGYRWVMIISLGLLNGLLFIVFFAPSNGVLVAGELLCGLAWGVFAIVGPAYASEVCPLSLRGYMTTFVNLCW